MTGGRKESWWGKGRGEKPDARAVSGGTRGTKLKRRGSGNRKTSGLECKKKKKIGTCEGQTTDYRQLRGCCSKKDQAFKRTTRPL